MSISPLYEETNSDFQPRNLSTSPNSSRKLTIACELPRLADAVLSSVSLPFSFEVVRIEGSEELWVRDGLSDLGFIVTETGGSLRANGLVILQGCEALLVSMPHIFAKSDLCPEKERRLRALSLALQSVVGARNHVMVKFDIAEDVLHTLQLPSEVSPTVSHLARSGWVAVEVCIHREQVGETMLLLKDAGSCAISVQDIQAFCP